MATPYFQHRLERVASTQDEAKALLKELPVVVLAGAQSEGRGRSGAEWLNADRCVAVSLAARVPPEDRRPLSLMAGVAAARVATGASLKWPNDVMIDGAKVGGVLVERSGDKVVIGLGLNIWWENAPDGMGCLEPDDPGPDTYAELGSRWAAEMMRLLEMDEWPLEEYRELSETIGRNIRWEPDGSGEAIDVASDGGLIVRVNGSEETLYSGAVKYVR